MSLRLRSRSWNTTLRFIFLSNELQVFPPGPQLNYITAPESFIMPRLEEFGA